MKSIVKLILFLLTFLVVAQANTPPLTSSYDLSGSTFPNVESIPKSEITEKQNPPLGEKYSKPDYDTIKSLYR